MQRFGLGASNVRSEAQEQQPQLLGTHPRSPERTIVALGQRARLGQRTEEGLDLL